MGANWSKNLFARGLSSSNMTREDCEEKKKKKKKKEEEDKKEQGEGEKTQVRRFSILRDLLVGGVTTLEAFLIILQLKSLINIIIIIILSIPVIFSHIKKGGLVDSMVAMSLRCGVYWGRDGSLSRASVCAHSHPCIYSNLRPPLPLVTLFSSG